MKRLLALLLLTIACGRTPQETESARPVRIGFSMDTLKEERWARDKALVEQRAREVGAIVDVQVANGDDAVQNRQCENLLTKDRKSTRLNSSHGYISYAVFCLKK